MPTITDRLGERRDGFPVTGFLAAIVIWFVGMAAFALAFDPAAVIVFGPSGIAVSAVAASDGSLLTAGSGFATATSDRAGFVRRLYSGGAWFVWPSLGHGCFSAGRFKR